MQVSKVSRLIRTARERQGMSQQQLADNLGYKSSQNISGWELGYNNVPRSAFKQLCKELGISPARFESAVVGDYRKTVRKFMN